MFDTVLEYCFDIIQNIRNNNTESLFISEWDWVTDILLILPHIALREIENKNVEYMKIKEK